jgi:hypothetical protein
MAHRLNDFLGGDVAGQGAADGLCARPDTLNAATALSRIRDLRGDLPWRTTKDRPAAKRDNEEDSNDREWAGQGQGSNGRRPGETEPGTWGGRARAE